MEWSHFIEMNITMKLLHGLEDPEGCTEMQEEGGGKRSQLSVLERHVVAV